MLQRIHFKCRKAVKNRRSLGAFFGREAKCLLGWSDHARRARIQLRELRPVCLLLILLIFHHLLLALTCPLHLFINLCWRHSQKMIHLLMHIVRSRAVVRYHDRREARGYEFDVARCPKATEGERINARGTQVVL